MRPGPKMNRGRRASQLPLLLPPLANDFQKWFQDILMDNSRIDFVGEFFFFCFNTQTLSFYAFHTLYAKRHLGRPVELR